MKRGVFPLLLAAMLSACASTPPDHEGLRKTREMTDMDGKPIDPGPGTLSGFGTGIGVGVGGWGRHGGVGVGVGLGTGW